MNNKLLSCDVSDKHSMEKKSYSSALRSLKVLLLIKKNVPGSGEDFLVPWKELIKKKGNAFLRR